MMYRSNFCCQSRLHEANIPLAQWCARFRINNAFSVLNDFIFLPVFWLQRASFDKKARISANISCVWCSYSGKLNNLCPCCNSVTRVLLMLLYHLISARLYLFVTEVGLNDSKSLHPSVRKCYTNSSLEISKLLFWFGYLRVAFWCKERAVRQCREKIVMKGI